MQFRGFRLCKTFVDYTFLSALMLCIAMAGSCLVFTIDCK